MIIKKYDAPPVETAAERYDRDWLNIPDLDTAGKDDYRHARTLLEQTVERKSRRYVDDNISAVTGGSPVFDPNLPEDNNGGGTPEPEPEVPSESPAGTYQENYTEEYQEKN